MAHNGLLERKKTGMVVLFMWACFVAMAAVMPVDATTYADLLQVVTTANSSCSIVVHSDVLLSGNLPIIDPEICQTLTITGACGRRLCKIDGGGKYSFIRGPHLSSVHLENLEVTRCRSSASLFSAPVLYVQAGATIRNCRFAGNVNVGQGGVISAFEGEITISNSEFSLNRASSGGAIHADSFATLTMTSVKFVRNLATKGVGGAINNVESTLLCQNCVFDMNRARDGGAVALSDDDGTDAVFTSCRFSGNRATKKGGKGGAVLVGIISPGAKFCRSTFVHNVALDRRGGRYVTQHVWIDMDEMSVEDSTVVFCPARPAAGVFVRPAFAANVKNDCSVC
ncbi:hypothetical protein CBR_g18601 [Chara braunii]|uniref:Right handed beta helix domain-containing protein n=1 Tax=Chara braunii TaxID=69332 RepID=A0A388JT88_CHABU|nr:hypothetical protein CBR_g18601 [Chara braunii]|eukprot:GBG61005.1 hypothetical protein CBR_g18601 [Chara braunii]